jgi:hypothetical protein
MQRHLSGPIPMINHDDRDDHYDLDELLHPANAFDHPSEVINDPDLTLSEKRAILASWASDACARKAAPALRRPPGKALVRFDDIMDALRDLDRQARENYRPHYRRVLAERRAPVCLDVNRGLSTTTDHHSTKDKFKGGHSMWVTFIATAVAASICLSTVNLASHLNKVRNAQLSPVIESIRLPSPTSPEKVAAPTVGASQQKKNAYPNPAAHLKTA